MDEVTQNQQNLIIYKTVDEKQASHSPNAIYNESKLLDFPENKKKLALRLGKKP